MTRKQRHLLTRIIVAAVLFLAGSLLHLPELAEMAVLSRLLCGCRLGYCLEGNHEHPAWTGV